MSNSYTIRLIKYEELPDLLQLYEQLHNEDPKLPINHTLYKLWDDIYYDPNMYYVVAVANDRVVSACVLIVIKNLTRNMSSYGVIENVITHTDYRKQGYGTKVLKKALDIAWMRDCYKVMLLTSSKEESTHNFYANAGFIQGEKTGFIARPK